MTESLEDTIAEAKAKRRKAEAAEAKEEIASELGYESAEDMVAKTSQDSGGHIEESAFAKSAVAISNANHNAGGLPEGERENVQQTHSNIKESVLAPVIELSIIQEATKKENAMFKEHKTVDELTQLENDIIEKEVSEMHTDILQLLVSVNARGRDDANLNLNSLVQGEQARLNAQALGLNPPSGSPGFWRKITNVFRSKP